MPVLKHVLLATLFLVPGTPETIQQPSTADLFFLLGDWEVERINSPGLPEERRRHGTLSCRETLDAQYIRCQYVIPRIDALPSRDDVYFNYNPIYERFESLWLSSTWPIKVLMHGSVTVEADTVVLRHSAEFPIENGVMEFVRGELHYDATTDSFERRTHIRTSEYAPGDWRHHMTEVARKVSGPPQPMQQN
ncbi:MAG: hypothetical protein GKS06_19905 [Acidobacteria bacterium]|nr:hypothetical protein [Acidobacteriota bacterium]